MLTCCAVSDASGNLFLRVHAGIGETEERFGVTRVVRRDGQADAGGDEEFAVGEWHGHTGGFVDEVEQGLGGAEIGDDNGELVAANTGEGVGRAQGAGEAFGDGAEQLIAGGVAEGVIHQLEAIEVEHDEAGAAAAARALEKRLRKPIVKEPAIWQAGEVIVQREIAIAGDLIFKHDHEHADGDEKLLQIPDVLGVGEVDGMLDHPGVGEEAERPGGEAEHDGVTAGARGGQAAGEEDGRRHVDPEEDPVNGIAEVGLQNGPDESGPAEEMQDAEADGSGREEAAGQGERDTNDGAEEKGSR